MKISMSKSGRTTLSTLALLLFTTSAFAGNVTIDGGDQHSSQYGIFNKTYILTHFEIAPGSALLANTDTPKEALVEVDSESQELKLLIKPDMMPNPIMVNLPIVFQGLDKCGRKTITAQSPQSGNKGVFIQIQLLEHGQGGCDSVTSNSLATEVVISERSSDDHVNAVSKMVAMPAEAMQPVIY